jgi:hypothetical protein
MVAMMGHILHFGYREIMEMPADKAKKYYQQAVKIIEAKNKTS